jgi:hypothetical protein
MSEPTVWRALLIDLDNCPRQLRHLPEALSGFARVVACHGGADPKVSLTLLPLLAQALHEGKLEVVRMQRGGPNAADFGLAFWAGRLAQQAPPEAEFVIFSGDRDLDHVVELLRKAGRRVERLDGNRFLPVVVPLERARPAPVAAAPVRMGDRLRQYQKMHLSRKEGRPSRQASLLNSLRAFCKDHPGVEAEAILRGLIARGHVAIDPAGRVTYDVKPPAPVPVGEKDASGS